MAEWIKHFRWSNEGATPEGTNLFTTGFVEGYKPPAPLFNYFFNQNMRIIDQLQDEVDTKASSADLSELENRVATNTRDIAQKADANHTHKLVDMEDYDKEFGTVYGAISDVEYDINTRKADKTELEELKGSVNTNTSNIDILFNGKSDINHKHYASGIARTETNGKTIEATLTELENKIDASGDSLPIVTASSSDGIAYTATVNGVTSLNTGLTIIIVPNRVSTNTALTLNVNGLGAKNIKMSVGGSTTGSVVNVPSNNFLAPNKPLLIQYDGIQWKSLLQVASATTLQGVVPVEKGGTGGTSIAELMGKMYQAGFARVAYQTYEGTGYRGEDYPNELKDWGFTPQFVFVSGGTNHPTYTVKSLMLGRGSVKENDALNSTVNVIWGEDSVKWYDNHNSATDRDESAAIAQKNEAGITYFAVAIG